MIKNALFINISNSDFPFPSLNLRTNEDSKENKMQILTIDLCQQYSCIAYEPLQTTKAAIYLCAVDFSPVGAKSSVNRV